MPNITEKNANDLKMELFATEIQVASSQMIAAANNTLLISETLTQVQKELEKVKQQKQALLNAQKERKDSLKALRIAATKYNKIRGNPVANLEALSALNKANARVLATETTDFNLMPALSANMTTKIQKQFETFNVRNNTLKQKFKKLDVKDDLPVQEKEIEKLAGQLIELNDKPIQKKNFLKRVLNSSPNTQAENRDAQTKLLLNELENKKKSLKAQIQPQEKLLKYAVKAFANTLSRLAQVENIIENFFVKNLKRNEKITGNINVQGELQKEAIASQLKAEADEASKVFAKARDRSPEEINRGVRNVADFLRSSASLAQGGKVYRDTNSPLTPLSKTKATERKSNIKE